LTSDKKHIVDKIVFGDKKDFEILFNENYERLAYYAYQYLKDKDNAEDVVQELFSKLWINRVELPKDANINAYLYSAVRNACLNQIKHQKVKEAHFSNFEIPVLNNDYIENKIDANDLSKLIETAIFELPPERQKIFLLSREQGLKYQEVADKLGISIKTVEAQMGKALRSLREQLKDYLVVFIAFFTNFLN
jgi:RNA polymerase sigma-70 factor, ECF subfamily